ncbi:MAG: ADOP family duplicated permease [Longimicrobiales bacterium]
MRWRRRTADDFDDEIRSHIEHETDRLVASGLTRGRARAEARRRFGSENAVREWFMESQGPVRFENVVKDMVLAGRSLRRQPGFALAAVLTLALGLGLSAGVFNVLYGLAMRPLPLPEADRLVTVHQEFPAFRMWPFRGWLGDAQIGTGEFRRRVNGWPDMASYPEYLAYRDGAGLLEDLAAFATVSVTLESDAPVAVQGLVVSCNYFSVLGVMMAVGRGFAPAECERPGEPAAVVMSHGLWLRRYGGDADVVGSELRLNGAMFTIIGVAEQGFGGTELYARDLWFPITMQRYFGGSRLAEENTSWLNLVGRLRSDVRVGRLEAELNGVASRLDAAVAGRVTRIHVYRATRALEPATPLNTGWAGTGVMLVAGFVLLLVCLNIMNLLLARAPARQQAVRIRLSLGASRRRIVSQLLVESILIALIGGVAGIALAYWMAPVALAALPIEGLQLDLSPDLRVFAFGLLISLIAAAAFGLVPALEATRIDLAAALRGGPSGARPRRGSRLRRTVVAVQLAGSLSLLVLAALFLRGIARAQVADPGYTIRNIHAFRPELQQQRYNVARSAAFHEEFRARVRALPGVEAVALAAFLPLGPRSTGRFRHASESETEAATATLVDHNVVSSGYFETVGASIVRGRGFEPADERATSPMPAVIGEAMARRFWSLDEPLGSQFRAGGQVYEVVGIARDAHNLSLAEPDQAFFYSAAPISPLAMAGEPDEKMPYYEFALIVRAAPGASIGQVVMGVARGIDPDVLVTTRSFEGIFAAEIEPARFVAIFAGVFGVLAMLLALVGVYGAVAHTVSQRTREIGVRIALGAERRDILAMILRQGTSTLLAGISTGVLLAVGGSIAARGMLFGLPPLDPVAFTGAVFVVTAAALAAMLRPARRAAGIDPMRTLRHE